MRTNTLQPIHSPASQAHHLPIINNFNPNLFSPSNLTINPISPLVRQFQNNNMSPRSRQLINSDMSPLTRQFQNNNILSPSNSVKRPATSNLFSNAKKKACTFINFYL